MRSVPLRRLLPAFLVISLIAAGAHAQTPEALQDRLVDAVNRAEQQADDAAERFSLNDTAGGCRSLRAAAAGMESSGTLVQQLHGQISQDSGLNDTMRDRMLHDLQDMAATFVIQKQDMDAEISSRCH